VPTYERSPEFDKMLASLSPEDRKRFRATILEKFLPDLKKGAFRRGLGVRKYQAGGPGVFEMRWAPNGRALFRFGPELKPGEPHIQWIAVGSHTIF
jgi:hypothetical protein